MPDAFQGLSDDQLHTLMVTISGDRHFTSQLDPHALSAALVNWFSEGMDDRSRREEYLRQVPDLMALLRIDPKLLKIVCDMQTSTAGAAEPQG